MTRRSKRELERALEDLSAPGAADSYDVDENVSAAFVTYEEAVPELSAGWRETTTEIGSGAVLRVVEPAPGATGGGGT